MPIELPGLAYADDALEPFISSTTLKVHHGRHHRGYVDKVNALIEGTPLQHSKLDAIVERSAHGLGHGDASAGALFNSAAQAWNHAFYWRSLRRPGGAGPSATLASELRAAFGGQDRFADAFKAAAGGHFGSGWAWLVLDGDKLEIVTTVNADTPIVHGKAPLLVIDVWEHAYYLDHHERRAAYVDGVVDNLLDWQFASRNHERAIERQAAGALAVER